MERLIDQVDHLISARAEPGEDAISLQSYRGREKANKTITTPIFDLTFRSFCSMFVQES
jgi:hypothetical protein